MSSFTANFVRKYFTAKKRVGLVKKHVVADLKEKLKKLMFQD